MLIVIFYTLTRLIPRILIQCNTIYWKHWYVMIIHAFGKIVHEDSIGKVIRVREVDAKEMEKRKMDASNLGFVTISSEGVFPDLAIDFMGQYEPKPEERPLPILDTYYFYFKGELFESTTKNILNHINPARRKEYKAYTRSAEILSRTESSNMKIWNDFFVHY